jgi:hypothetical protein
MVFAGQAKACPTRQRRHGRDDFPKRSIEFGFPLRLCAFARELAQLSGGKMQISRKGGQATG